MTKLPLYVAMHDKKPSQKKINNIVLKYEIFIINILSQFVLIENTQKKTISILSHPDLYSSDPNQVK